MTIPLFVFVPGLIAAFLAGVRFAAWHTARHLPVLLPVRLQKPPCAPASVETADWVAGLGDWQEGE